ncbi:hypothetical protein GQ44DRAFT_823914 [Phaeosphaeriaceae sp. PMI808]|nr:hypothetical protein GQ44DRAFT_823914 [Phaeosphaeriaceae sp. PMI808]
MSSKIGYYNVEEFNKQKGQQERKVKVPPKANFLAAVCHIRSLFEGKNLSYGIMGGLEMLCLGYRREMPDLQIAYDDRDFHHIRAKLDSDQRVRLPEGMNSLFPAKVLIRTGPAYKDEGCTQAADIEVDLLPPGSHGTPLSGSLTSNLVLLSLKIEGKLKSFKCLNMLHLVKSLVHYCRVRDLAWDPRKDILFLCQHYGEEVHSIRHQLDQKAVQQNFLGTPFFSRLSAEVQNRCYQILLGTQPPPTMAITPPAPTPGHKYSASASDLVTRPLVSSHKSSPSLNAQCLPGLLSPPLPRNLKAPQKSAFSGDHQPSELADSSRARSSISMEPPIGTRDSRSRYRPINAPHSRPNDTEAIFTSMKHSKLLNAREVTSGVNSPYNIVQNSPNHHLHAPSHLDQGSLAKQNRKSMPNLNAGASRPIPAYAFNQIPSLNGFTNFPQQMQPYVSPIEMSATPAPINPGQQYMKPQLGLGGHLPGKHAVSNIPITERPMPPQARPSQQGPESFGVAVSGTPRSNGQTNLHLANPNININGKPQPVSAVELPSNQICSVESRILSSQSNDAYRAQVPLAPVELDAEYEIGQYIAELSVERSTPAPGRDSVGRTFQGQYTTTQTKSTQASVTTMEESPVSPPDSHASLDPSHVQHEGVSVRPLNLRTRSAPVADLPVSLMVGGPAHDRQLNKDMRHPLGPGLEQATAPMTNAWRYTGHYTSQTPPSSGPNGAQASVRPGPSSGYRAYHPPSLPLSPPDAQHVASEGDEGRSRQRKAGKLGDVDGTQADFRAHAGHKREASHDSHASNASHDSTKLAQEYQAELPSYGVGYGTRARSGVDG